MSTVGDPTPAQITLAQTNIGNCMDWLNHVHSYLQDVINTVYHKVNEDPSNDPGQNWANTFIDDLLWGIGGASFPGNAFVSAFLANFFWNYVTAPPLSLQGDIGSVWDRFNQTFLQANDDLADIYNNIPGHWNDVWTNPVTKEETTISSMGEGTVSMPDKYSKLYQTMTDNAVANYKLSLTKALLPLKWHVAIDQSGWFVKGGDATFIENYLKKFWNNFQAYYFTYHSDTGGNVGTPQHGIMILENFLGTGSSSAMYAHKAPDDLCNWLFQDDGYGRTTNPSGLATRHDVFCNWKLKNSLPASAPNVGNNAPMLSAVPDENTEGAQRIALKWHALFHQTPRQQIEQRIIEKAEADVEFLRNLVMEPKKTISEFLGLEFPEGVEVEVLQETPGHYKMVLPLIGAPEPQS